MVCVFLFCGSLISWGCFAYWFVISLRRRFCLILFVQCVRVTPPFLVRSIQGVFRRYAVRKGSVRSTQKSCYMVRRHLILLLKGPIFIKKHNKRDIQSQIILNFLRARFARAFWGSFQHL